MYTGLSILKSDSLFEVSNNSYTRGHSLKLSKHHRRCDLRKYVFLQSHYQMEFSYQQAVNSSSLIVLNRFKSALTEQEMLRWVFSWIILFNPMVLCLVVKSGPQQSFNLAATSSKLAGKLCLKPTIYNNTTLDET